MMLGRRRILWWVMAISVLLLVLVMVGRLGKQPRSPASVARAKHAATAGKDAKKAKAADPRSQQQQGSRGGGTGTGSGSSSSSSTSSSFAADSNKFSEVNRTRSVFDPLDLRVFQTTGDQLLYLFDRVLAAPWSSQPKNSALYRELFFRQMNNMTCEEDVILTHRNVRLGDVLPYSFTNTVDKRKRKFFYNIDEKFLDKEKLPEISPLFGKHFRRCNVIGNSGILLNSKCGKEIDAADFVFRSNVPPMQPFARDAGLKANFTTMNPSVAHRKYNQLKTTKDEQEFTRDMSEYDGILWLPCISSTVMVDVCFTAKHVLEEHARGNQQIVLSNPNHYLAMQKFWAQRNVSHYLSTGFYLTHLSLAMCDETHLYGFWPFSAKLTDSRAEGLLTGGNATTSQREVSYHYFDDLPGPSGAHSMHEEFSVLLQMHGLGMLRMHTDDCRD